MDAFYKRNDRVRFFYIDQYTDFDDIESPFKSFVNTAHQVLIDPDYRSFSNYLVRKYYIEG